MCADAQTTISFHIEPWPADDGDGETADPPAD
jgi:hypothetical protein